MKRPAHVALFASLFVAALPLPAQTRTGISADEQALEAKQSTFLDREEKALAAETAREKRGDCKTEGDTPSVNACMTREMGITDANYKTFVLAVGGLLRAATPDEAAAAADVGHRFDVAEAQWATYRKSACDTVYQHYMAGTVRGFAYGSCMQTLERQHMHDLATIYSEMLQH